MSAPTRYESTPTNTASTLRFAVAPGDGIGPEIMDATLRILRASGLSFEAEEIVLGERAYLAGQSAGIEDNAWDAVRRHRVLLKGPLTTPQGGGFKSVNVTLRKKLGLYANVRPCLGYAPFVATRHPKLDVVIIRENEEDLYAGIEHRQTDDVVQCLKLITRPGCERIVRYAFEYARAHGRKKVTCLTKDNIMKMTDGLFRRVFEEIGAEYPELVQEHLIIDIGTARLADTPQDFDVVVTGNLYGDILSDVVAQIAGSVGLAGSANIGSDCAMFEAIHGSAPTLAGRGIANPSGLLHAAILMLVHLGRSDEAARIQNAWLRTLEDGIHTADFANDATTRERVGSAAFADAVIARLGQLPQKLAPVQFVTRPTLPARAPQPRAKARKDLVGVDVFLHWSEGTPADLAARLQPAAGADFHLQMITNRGVSVWPHGFAETHCTDHWRCRFLGSNAPITHRAVLGLLGRIADTGLDFIKTEHLCTFDGVAGYSAGQGQ